MNWEVNKSMLNLYNKNYLFIFELFFEKYWIIEY